MGDVNNQNYLSFRQPLKRSPPGSFPWGLTFPLCLQDGPRRGEEGAVIRGRVTRGVMSGDSGCSHREAAAVWAGCACSVESF